jgi:hypothetical protein
LIALTVVAAAAQEPGRVVLAIVGPGDVARLKLDRLELEGLRRKQRTARKLDVDPLRGIGAKMVWKEYSVGVDAIVSVPLSIAVSVPVPDVDLVPQASVVFAENVFQLTDAIELDDSQTCTVTT